MYDSDVQCDETTGESLDTHCCECGMEHSACSCKEREEALDEAIRQHDAMLAETYPDPPTDAEYPW